MRRPIRKAELREQSLRRLRKAAFRIFVSQGYHGTTVDDIASAVGMTKGAVYFYFKSKQDLYLHLLDIAEANIVDALIAHLASREGSAMDKIIAFFHFGSMHGIERPDELLCLIQGSIEFKNRKLTVTKRIGAIYERIYGVLEEVVEAGKSEGEFKASLPTREVVSMIVSTHDGMMLEWHRRRGEIDGSHLVRAVRTTMLRGLTAL